MLEITSIKREVSKEEIYNLSEIIYNTYINSIVLIKNIFPNKSGDDCKVDIFCSKINNKDLIDIIAFNVVAHCGLFKYHNNDEFRSLVIADDDFTLTIDMDKIYDKWIINTTFEYDLNDKITVYTEITKNKVTDILLKRES